MATRTPMAQPCWPVFRILQRASEKQAAASPPAYVWQLPASAPASADTTAARRKLLGVLLLTGLGSFGIGAALPALFGSRSTGAPSDVPLLREEAAALEGESAEKASADVPLFSWPWWRGDAAERWHQMPLAVPALVAAILGPLFLGSRVSQDWRKSQDESRREEELAQAKQEYESALEGEPVVAEKLSAALDRIYDLTCKAASASPSPPAAPVHIPVSPTAVAYPAGALLALMGLAGLGGTYSGYKWMEGRKADAMLEDMLKRRALLQAQAQLSPVTVRSSLDDED